MTTQTVVKRERTFFGHPWGLATLFCTEMWERFSFYGMQGILVLFLADSAAEGGLGMEQGTAKALLGAYMASVYLVALPGGWLADRVLGPRRAVLAGGVVIMAGHVSMAVPGGAGFVYLGLILIILGSGLLKPNISTMVGHLYRPDDDARRDAGFSLFYMGINLGAFAGPIITGYLGEEVSWHAGFGVAALGMGLGLLQYLLGGRHLKAEDNEPAHRLTARERAALLRYSAPGVGALAVVAGLAALTGTLTVDNVTIAVTVVAVVVPAAYFAFMLLGSHEITPPERTRLKAYIWLFIAAALFWMIYDQSANEVNLFAEEKTDRDIFGWIMPASWSQAINPVFVIIFASPFAALWLKVGNRVSLPMKFAVGLALCGLSFVLMSGVAALAAGGTKVSIMWLAVVFLVQVFGELCLSPVGLSMTTKLAPAAFASQMMGVWFLASAVGDAIGGQTSRLSDTVMPDSVYYLWQGSMAVAAGVALMLFAGKLRRLLV